MVFLKNFKESTTRPTGIFREVEWGEGGGGGCSNRKNFPWLGRDYVVVIVILVIVLM